MILESGMGYADQNLALLRRLALNVLKRSFYSLPYFDAFALPCRKTAISHILPFHTSQAARILLV